VPFGTLLAFAILVFVRLIRGDGKIGDGLAAAGIASFWIAAKAADENHFVYRHGNSPCDGEDTMRERKREIRGRSEQGAESFGGVDAARIASGSEN
jgi:hypothetical protein